MKRFLPLLFLLAAFTGYSADRITATVTLTNIPVTGQAINGRIWTNSTSAETIQTNGIAGSTTNLFLHFSATPLGSPQWILEYAGTNAVTFEGQVGQAVAITLVGTNWASVTYATNSGPQAKTAVYPFSSIRFATNQTNQASSFVKGMSDHSTNAFSETSNALTNHVNRTQAQDIGNKRLTNSTLELSAITNASRIHGTVAFLTNGQYMSPTFRTPTMTNGVNYGNAFSSPGSGGEQFGASANASGANSLAVGTSAAATNASAVAVGNSARAWADSAIAIGDGAQVRGTNGIGIGTGASVVQLAEAGIGIGYAVSVEHANSVVIGDNAASTTTNQIRLGASTHVVSTPGRIEAGSYTNALLTGTNVINGHLAYTPRVNTALANGNNAGVLLGTNVYLRLMGPSAAYAINGFAAEWSGAIHVLQLTNPAGPITIANESGTDPTAANRILTSTGADLSLTNNPAFLQIIYDGAASRWRVMTHSR